MTKSCLIVSFLFVSANVFGMDINKEISSNEAHQKHMVPYNQEVDLSEGCPSDDMKKSENALFSEGVGIEFGSKSKRVNEILYEEVSPKHEEALREDKDNFLASKKLNEILKHEEDGRDSSHNSSVKAKAGWYKESSSKNDNSKTSITSVDTKVNQDFKKEHIIKKNDSITSVLAEAGYPKLGQEKLFP